MKFTIPGEPCGKARPRVVRNGAFTRTFTPEKTVNYEALVKLEYSRQCAEFFDKGVPIKATITAYFSTPASASKKKLLAMLERLLLPIKKPDWDNIGKIVCDALNGVAYHDDAQIVDARVLKYYATTPRVEVEITEVIS